MDREKIFRIIDELIFEAQKEPTWKAENALKCLKNELLKEQEAVEPILVCEGRNKYYNYYVCPRCDDDVDYEQKYCSECGARFLWKEQVPVKDEKFPS